MGIVAKNIIVGDKTIKEEPKAPPAPVNSLQQIKNRVTRNAPFEEKVEEKSHYEVIKEGDLVKHHNTKSHYLNDMTGFNN